MKKTVNDIKNLCNKPSGKMGSKRKKQARKKSLQSRKKRT